MTQPARTTVLADDHPSVLRTTTELMRSWGWSIAGTAETGLRALAKIEELQPSLAVVDVRLPGMNGIELVRAAAKKAPHTKLVLYTGFHEAPMIREALDAGVNAIILKSSPLEDLRRALETVATGGFYLDPVAAGTMLTHQPTHLTQREREVLRMLADGLSYREIGHNLFISAETVRAHAARANQRLGARSRTHAVATAMRQGLIA